MSDLISKSALINELQKYFVDNKIHKNDLTEVIVKQPTVEPVRVECSECSRRLWYQRGYDDGLNANKWIPVSEGLPENETEVEICCVRKYIGAGDEKKISRITARAFYTDGTMTTEDSSFTWEDTNDWEYVEEKDAYIIPEGWWEFVTFSEQFSAVDAEVIAWMPLPEPYKEK